MGLHFDKLIKDLERTVDKMPEAWIEIRPDGGGIGYGKLSPGFKRIEKARAVADYGIYSGGAFFASVFFLAVGLVCLLRHGQEIPEKTPVPTQVYDTQPRKQKGATHMANNGEQTVVVKHRSSGCLGCLVIILILVIGLPVLAFVFKVGFLVAIFESIKQAIGM